MANAFVSIRAESERAKHWQAVFGRLDNIPVTGWLPSRATLPGFNRPQLVYMLDLTKCTEAELAHLVVNLAERFNLSPLVVQAELPRFGCPILADDVIFHTTDPLPLIMADDLDDGMEDEDEEDDGLDYFGADDEDEFGESFYDYDEGLPL